MRIKLLCAMALLLGSCAKDNGETNPNTESDTQVVGFTMTKSGTDETLTIPETYRFTVWNSTTTSCQYDSNTETYATGTYKPTTDGTVSYLTPCKVDDTTGDVSSDNDANYTVYGLQVSSTTQNLVATRPAKSLSASYSIYPVNGGTGYSRAGYDIYRKDFQQFYLGIEESVYFNGMAINNLNIFTFSKPLEEQRATITLKIKSKEEGVTYTVNSITYCDIPTRVRYHPYYGHYVHYGWLKNYELVSSDLTVDSTTEKTITNDTTLTDEDSIPLTDTDGKFNLLAMDYTSSATYAVVPSIKVNFTTSSNANVDVEIPLYRDFTPQLNYEATLSITSIYATLSIAPTEDWENESVGGAFGDNEFTEFTVAVTPSTGDDGTWEDGGDIAGSINATDE